MTREKKIDRDLYIENLIYLFIIKRGAWDYWLEPELFDEVARTVNCSVHKVKRVFFKKILPTAWEWLTNFTY